MNTQEHVEKIKDLEKSVESALKLEQEGRSMRNTNECARSNVITALAKHLVEELSGGNAWKLHTELERELMDKHSNVRPTRGVAVQS